jgi:acyl-coenzyme A synthetase/AMP-(fatty) acid ligase
MVAILNSGWIYIPANRTFQRSDDTSIINIPVLELDDDHVIIQGEDSVTKINPSLEVKLLSSNRRIVTNSSFKDTTLINRAAAFFYTSGTTGNPKIIVQSLDSLLLGAKYVSDSLKISDSDIIAGTLSLDFDYGVNQVLISIYNRIPYVICQFGSRKSNWIEIAKRFECTIIPAMPFLIEKYFRSSLNFCLNKVRLVTSSGAPFGSNHEQLVRKLCPDTAIAPMYGLSEAFRATILEPTEYKKRPESVGKPIGNTEISIRDMEFKTLPVGIVGEIYQSNGCMSWGYFGDEESTASRFINDTAFPGKIWLRSGDLGYLDSEGFLYIVGRVEAQIKRFGIRVSVSEVEKVYQKLPGVRQVVAIPLIKNATESDIGLVITVEGYENHEFRELEKSVPIELRANKVIFVEEIEGNYNEGKPDRKKIYETYFGS